MNGSVLNSRQLPGGECLQETERSASEEVDRIGMHVCLESVGDDFPTAKDDYSHSPYEVKDNWRG